MRHFVRAGNAHVQRLADAVKRKLHEPRWPLALRREELPDRISIDTLTNQWPSAVADP